MELEITDTVSTAITEETEAIIEIATQDTMCRAMAAGAYFNDAYTDEISTSIIEKSKRSLYNYLKYQFSDYICFQ